MPDQNPKNPVKREQSTNEKRVRRLTHLYYSRPDVQKALFDFSKNREVSPRYFEGFGKRPDMFQYPGDVFELVKKGATSFHCSQELWGNPLEIETGMSAEKLNELREGWDLLLDIDSKYLDYSKILAQQILKVLKFYRVKNVGIKFSGSKGFHLIIPWKAFPEEINSVRVSDMFPEWPRILTNFIISATKNELVKKISELTKPNKYVRDFRAPKEVMPDLILVSPRHLFRMPYSLHEKTALASVVLTPEQLENFQPRDADPLTAKVKNFTPDSEPNEASELLREALDWHKNRAPETDTSTGKSRGTGGDGQGVRDYKPIQISDFSEKNFPPAIQKILLGVQDGRKRSVFILLNFFRAIGMDRAELEKKLYDWNKKNPVPLQEGYIKSQILWSYRNKIVPPPNYDKDYYQGVGAKPTEEEMRYKNPVNFMARKFAQAEEEKVQKAKYAKKMAAKEKRAKKVNKKNAVEKKNIKRKEGKK